MDAYAKGLDGKQAAWAAKKYHGHCASGKVGADLKSLSYLKLLS